MKKSSVWVILILLIVALAASGIQEAATESGRINNLAAVTAAGGGKAWTAVYENDTIRFYLLGSGGVRQESFSVPRTSGTSVAQIRDMAADSQGNVYFIKQYTDASSGKTETRQELVIYTPNFLPFRRIKTIRLDSKDDPDDIRYLDVHLSTSVILTGVSADNSKLVRKAYDIDALKDTGTATVKSLRTYPADPGGEVFRAVPSGADVAYISKTGKVYISGEDGQNPVQIYPDRQAQLSSYASFIHESVSGQVIIGEQSSGNILRLYTGDGKVEYVMEGGQAFGTLKYRGEDVLELSFAPENSEAWVAVVQNKSAGSAELVIYDRGDYLLITNIDDNFLATVLKVAGNAVLYFLALLAAAGLFALIRRLVTRGRMILIKLIFVSIPLLILALALFGAYSYVSYQSALSGTYEKKVEDQGNLLRALFSSASFDKITSPGRYNSTEYNYLRAQMGTRDVYTSSAYFVNGALYTGVDWDLPCLYPFGVRYSESARELYRMAALTGAQQVGVITDGFGERIACITPVGSSSGNTVFLLETSIFQAEIGRQTSGFIRDYLIVSAICLIAACLLLLTVFLRILQPLGGIIDGLEQFSVGNRTVRLEAKTNDELADIARVFNKMAKDIDVQIYNLKTMGETYYRFVPQQIFRLLGRENLADVDLGSAVEGKYCILVANLMPRQGRIDFENMREMINCFFAIVHRVCNENGAMVLSDSAGLQNLRIICPDGNTAVKIAIEAIARIDGHNAGSYISQRLEVSFFLHSTQIGFGICGDADRYIPAMISTELDGVLAKCEDFRRLSSRLIATQAAYDVLDSGKYFHRFIGYAAGGEEDPTGLYDFYDSSSPHLIRLLNDTLDAFNKAMELYRQKRFYDAKNMFAVVLRENQYDNVARHYIFQCEKNL